LVGIGLHVRHSLGEVGLEPDVLAGHALDQAEGAVDDVVEVDDLWLQPLAPAESE
jgi:hypothetical protein